MESIFNTPLFRKRNILIFFLGLLSSLFNPSLSFAFTSPLELAQINEQCAQVAQQEGEKAYFDCLSSNWFDSISSEFDKTSAERLPEFAFEYAYTKTDYIEKINYLSTFSFAYNLCAIEPEQWPVPGETYECFCWIFSRVKDYFNTNLEYLIDKKNQDELTLREDDSNNSPKGYDLKPGHTPASKINYTLDDERNYGEKLSKLNAFYRGKDIQKRDRKVQPESHNNGHNPAIVLEQEVNNEKNPIEGTAWSKILFRTLGPATISYAIYRRWNRPDRLTNRWSIQINRSFKSMENAVAYKWKNPGALDDIFCGESSVIQTASKSDVTPQLKAFIKELERQGNLGNLNKKGEVALNSFRRFAAEYSPTRNIELGSELAGMSTGRAIFTPCMVTGVFFMVVSAADELNAEENDFIPDSVKLNTDYNMFISGASENCWENYLKKDYERIYSDFTKLGYVELMNVFNSYDLDHHPFKYQAKLGIIEILRNKWKAYSPYTPDHTEFAMAGIDSLADIEKMNDSLRFDFERNELPLTASESLKNDELRSLARETCDDIDSFLQLADTITKAKDFTYYPDNYFPVDNLN